MTDTDTDLLRLLSRRVRCRRKVGRRGAPVAGIDPVARAGMLRAVADRLDGAGHELVPLAITESHLSETRLRGELLRTTFQLRFLAGVIEEGDHLQACIDTPDERWPLGTAPGPATLSPAAGPRRLRRRQLPVRLQRCRW